MAVKTEWKDTGLRRLASKDGKFSKTSLIHSLVWLFVLAVYAPVTLLLVGTQVDLPLTSAVWTIPSFDVVAISALLGLASGTYLGNNYLKNALAKIQAPPVVVEAVEEEEPPVDPPAEES